MMEECIQFLLRNGRLRHMGRSLLTKIMKKRAIFIDLECGRITKDTTTVVGNTKPCDQVIG